MKQNDKERWEKLKDIWKIIDRLRSESGCPWDRRQTPETIQTYLLEEAHEGAAAVRAGKPREVAEELGDVLFMVFFLAYLYEERGDFSLDEVCDLISAKMIRRHPHVFGETSVGSAEEVKDNWEKIKAEEKNESGRKAEPVPETLPALIRAYRIVSRIARKENGTWNDVEKRAIDFSRKAREFADAMGSGKQASAESVGDLFLDLVNLSRIAGLRPEDCLHQVLRKIERD